MKNRIMMLVSLTGLLLTGCEPNFSIDMPVSGTPAKAAVSKRSALNNATATNVNQLVDDIRADFVIGDLLACSNALVHQGPPDGWSIYSDGQGHWAPAHNGYVSGLEWNIRTSRWEAVIAAWRTKLIVDEPPTTKLFRTETFHPDPPPAPTNLPLNEFTGATNASYAPSITNAWAGRINNGVYRIYATNILYLSVPSRTNEMKLENTNWCRVPQGPYVIHVNDEQWAKLTNAYGVGDTSLIFHY